MIIYINYKNSKILSYYSLSILFLAFIKYKSFVSLFLSEIMHWDYAKNDRFMYNGVLILKK